MIIIPIIEFDSFMAFNKFRCILLKRRFSEIYCESFVFILTIDMCRNSS